MDSANFFSISATIFLVTLSTASFSSLMPLSNSSLSCFFFFQRARLKYEVIDQQNAAKKNKLMEEQLKEIEELLQQEK
jgi:hypothetical protein